jgi:hypothetical protein
MTPDSGRNYKLCVDNAGHCWQREGLRYYALEEKMVGTAFASVALSFVIFQHYPSCSAVADLVAAVQS